jgi:uncharacterized protein (DUF983 family)
MLWIGLTRGCPVCARRGLFQRWFTMAEHCPRCEFRFERREGQFVGAVGMNTIFTFAGVLGVLIVGMILTLPDIPTVELATITIVVAIFGPIAFYPSSKTLWGGIDLLLSPLEPGESTWTVEGPIEH